jgi:membrane associated rhomboid family serine protease
MSEPNCGGVDAALHGELHPLEDQPLRVGDPLRLLRGGIALDPEHLLLERPAVVEGQDVQLSVIAERHRIDLLGFAFRSWRSMPARLAKWSSGRPRATRRIIGPMASGPDLFVVCKSCGSEVSPYITECPYCGTRLRKRAPKLERGGTPKPPKRSRPRLAPLRRGEMPGIRPDRRPYVTILIVLASVVVTLVGWIGLNLIADETLNGLGLSTVAAWGELALGGPFDGEWWKLWTTQLVYGSTGYEVAALSAIALFGTLLERRHGWWAPLMVFVIGGGAGMALVVGLDEGRIAVGGNAAALAMLAAWSMRDILGRRAGREDDADLLGVLAIAALLVLLPLVTDGASSLAGLGGGLAGIVLGLGLARAR